MQYDTDVTTWSPQGRIFQIEYAMEAVKQGSAAVGLKVGAAAPPCRGVAHSAGSAVVRVWGLVVLPRQGPVFSHGPRLAGLMIR